MITTKHYNGKVTYSFTLPHAVKYIALKLKDKAAALSYSLIPVEGITNKTDVELVMETTSRGMVDLFRFLDECGLDFPMLMKAIKPITFYNLFDIYIITDEIQLDYVLFKTNRTLGVREHWQKSAEQLINEYGVLYLLEEKGNTFKVLSEAGFRQEVRDIKATLDDITELTRNTSEWSFETIHADEYRETLPNSARGLVDGDIFLKYIKVTPDTGKVIISLIGDTRGYDPVALIARKLLEIGLPLPQGMTIPKVVAGLVLLRNEKDHQMLLATMNHWPAIKSKPPQFPMYVTIDGTTAIAYIQPTEIIRSTNEEIKHKQEMIEIAKKRLDFVTGKIN